MLTWLYKRQALQGYFITFLLAGGHGLHVVNYHPPKSLPPVCHSQPTRTKLTNSPDPTEQ